MVAARCLVRAWWPYSCYRTGRRVGAVCRTLHGGQGPVGAQASRLRSCALPGRLRERLRALPPPAWTWTPSAGRRGERTPPTAGRRAHRVPAAFRRFPVGATDHGTGTTELAHRSAVVRCTLSSREVLAQASGPGNPGRPFGSGPHPPPPHGLKAPERATGYSPGLSSELCAPLIPGLSPQGLLAHPMLTHSSG